MISFQVYLAMVRDRVIGVCVAQPLSAARRLVGRRQLSDESYTVRYVLYLSTFARNLYANGQFLSFQLRHFTHMGCC